MKKLIVNSDDFGISKAFNYGVIEAFYAGGISSTTCLVNAPDFKHACKLAKENRGLGVGLHLNLTMFKSLTQNPVFTSKMVFSLIENNIVNQMLWTISRLKIFI